MTPEGGSAPDFPSFLLGTSPRLQHPPLLLRKAGAGGGGEGGAAAAKKCDSSPWRLGKITLASDTYSQKTFSIFFGLSEIVSI